MPQGVDIVAVSVGNTRTRAGRFVASRLDDSIVLANGDPGLVEAVRGLVGDRRLPFVVASVNDPVADRLAGGLRESRAVAGVYRIGRDVPILMRHALPDASTLGQDRLLNAMGAYERAEQACVVVDAGTAVTVDFVDGEGVFQGGVIAPGLNMGLRALHEQTAALPLVTYAPPDFAGGPFGRATRDAMLRGVHVSIVGLLHVMVERYAEHYGAYPQVVATGGDAPALFEHDPVVEHIVPDLTLIGIHAACAAALADDEAEELFPGGGGGDGV